MRFSQYIPTNFLVPANKSMKTEIWICPFHPIWAREKERKREREEHRGRERTVGVFVFSARVHPSETQKQMKEKEIM